MNPLHTTGWLCSGRRAAERNEFSASWISALFSRHWIRRRIALRGACGVLAIAVFALTASTGNAREEVESTTADRIASVSQPGAIGARGPTQSGPSADRRCADGGCRQRLPQSAPAPLPHGSLPDFIQPVEIRGPEGMQISIETAEGWSPLSAAPLRMGLAVGSPYRLRLAGSTAGETWELFPSIRLLARLATPPGMAWRFPVELVVDEADISSALAGSLVRRVVYVSCDPEREGVTPANWFDVRPGDDAMQVATTLGDPIAEIIMGNRLPVSGDVR
jgi:hypothetical protein